MICYCTWLTSTKSTTCFGVCLQTNIIHACYLRSKQISPKFNFYYLCISYTRMLALLISPNASPTANRVDLSFRATIGYTRTTSFNAAIELWRQILRMTEFPGSIVCNTKLITCKPVHKLDYNTESIYTKNYFFNLQNTHCRKSYIIQEKIMD